MYIDKIDILVRLEPRCDLVVARNAWWNEIVKSNIERTKHVFFVFCLMFSLFQRGKMQKLCRPFFSKKIFNIFSP